MGVRVWGAAGVSLSLLAFLPAAWAEVVVVGGGTPSSTEPAGGSVTVNGMPLTDNGNGGNGSGAGAAGAEVEPAVGAEVVFPQREFAPRRSWYDSYGREGLYTSVKGGWTWPNDQDYNLVPGAVTTELDSGWTGNAAVGLRKGMFRAELEAMRQENKVSEHRLNGAATSQPGGKAKVTSVMANVYADVGRLGRLKPYVGVGAGWANLDLDNYRWQGTSRLDGDDGVFAWQAMAGASYDLNPCWSVTGEYRYFRTGDADIRATSGAMTHPNYENNMVLVGLKYTW